MFARICGLGKKGIMVRGTTTKSMIRLNSGDAKTGISKIAKEGKTLKETSMASEKGTAISMGQGALAGAAVVGLGALAFYGMGMSEEQGTVDKAVIWPNYIRERVRDTYMYFGGSLLATAGTASLAFRSNTLMNLVTRNTFLALGVSLAILVGSLTILHSIPYTPGLGPKQLAYLGHCAVQGILLAPFCLLGGPILAKAAWYTVGMVGGLSTVAVCAPSDKFLYRGGALGMGLGVVFCACIGTMFIPPTTAIGASLHSMAVYGGLILFGGFLLYDTQKIIKKAETLPPGPGSAPFDPINNSIDIYLDTINIFIRMAYLVAGGDKK